MNESLSDRDTPPCSSKKRGKHCATFDCYNYSFYDGNGLFTGHHFFRFPTERSIKENDAATSLNASMEKTDSSSRMQL